MVGLSKKSGTACIDTGNWLLSSGTLKQKQLDKVFPLAAEQTAYNPKKNQVSLRAMMLPAPILMEDGLVYDSLKACRRGNARPAAHQQKVINRPALDSEKLVACPLKLPDSMLARLGNSSHISRLVLCMLQWAMANQI